MGNFAAIADIGDALIRLLQDNISDDLIHISASSIVLLSPADVSDPDIRMTLFLYNVAENPHLKNQELRAGSTQYPPLSLDLHYLLTTYASAQIQDRTQRTLEEHRILGWAMRVFYDNATLSGSIFQGGLKDTSEQLHILLNPLPLEDLTRIWSAFPNRPFRPSISYMVTPARIDSMRMTGGPRVVQRDLEYFQIK